MVSSLYFIYSGGPLLLMELAFLLRGVGAEVCWITNQKPSGTDEVIYNLENKMLDRGVQVHVSLLHCVNIHECYLVNQHFTWL